MVNPAYLALRLRFTGDSPEQGETQPFEFIAALCINLVINAAVYEAASGGVAVGEKDCGTLTAKVHTGQVLVQQSFNLLAVRSWPCAP